MKTITGSFRWSEPFGPPGNERPAEDGLLILRLSQDATVISTGETISSNDVIEIPLDENGAIPEGTQIAANDELEPAGTSYEVCVHLDSYRYVSANRHYIVGEGPINLNALPLASDVDKAEKEAADAAEEVRERERRYELYPWLKPIPPRTLPAQRKSGTNYLGFFAGPIHAPANVGSCTPPTGKAFAVYGFTLPFKAVINCVSIYVSAVRPGLGHHVIVGLYEANGKKVCSTVLAASKAGISSAEFESAVNLSAGDYFLAWSASNEEIKVHSIGANYRDQFELANGGEGATVVGTASGLRGNTFPDTLGAFTPSPSVVPILAYFKA